MSPLLSLVTLINTQIKSVIFTDVQDRQESYITSSNSQSTINLSQLRVKSKSNRIIIIYEKGSRVYFLIRYSMNTFAIYVYINIQNDSPDCNFSFQTSQWKKIENIQISKVFTQTFGQKLTSTLTFFHRSITHPSSWIPTMRR